MAKRGESRKTRAERRRRQAQKKKLGAGVILFGGILLVGFASWSMLNNGSNAQADINYTEDDISYERPFQAVHEMESGPPIPFLAKSDPQPQIVISETFHNFGIIDPTAIVEREFVIANYGEAPLTISRAYTTCGCTTADFTSATIPPGGVSLVTLVLDAGFHDVSGQTVRRGLIIENNDPKNSSAEIWVQATVRN
jgi:hypothetical protein